MNLLYQQGPDGQEVSRMSRVKITVVRKNGVVQFLSHRDLYATEDHFVFKSSNLGKTWLKICRIPPDQTGIVGKIKDDILRKKFVRRLRKNVGIHNVVVLRTGTIVIQYDKIYRYCGKGKYAVPVFDLVREGANGPLKNGLCYDPYTGNLYFGEYVIDRPAAVRIYRGAADATKWEVCYRFPQGQVRHVHSIFADPVRHGRLWVCTGDNDQECGLYYTDDDFRSLRLYGGGDQSWRMVSLLFSGEYIIWGSDAGQDARADDKNYIYRLNVESGTKERLCCIDKPAYYSISLRNGTMYIATTFEPNIKRDVTPSADVWKSKDGIHWEMICSFSYKNALRKIGTQYGTIFLPRNDNWQSEKLFFTPVNIEEIDNNIVSFS